MAVESRLPLTLAETIIFLPPGNVFLPDRFDDNLQWQRCSDPSHLSEVFQEAVSVVTRDYLQPGWRFASAAVWAIAPGDYSSLEVFFTHPDRQTVTPECPAPDFLQPERILPEYLHQRFNSWFLDTNPLNEVLVTADRYAYNSVGTYQYIERRISERRLMFKTTRAIKLYQTGVVRFHASMYSVDDEIRDKQDDIFQAAEDYKDTIATSVAQIRKLRQQKPQNARTFWLPQG